MHNFSDWLSNGLLNKVTKISENKYLVALRDGMVITVPFTILGSIFLIVNNLPFTWWNDFISPVSFIFDPIVSVTFGMLSLIVLLGISYQMARLNKIDVVSGMVISAVAFILVMLNNQFEVDVSNFGSGGMFTAIIVALFSGELLAFFYKKNWTIKLPESVPPAVMRSFSALIPGALTILFFWLIRIVLNININDVITSIFAPLVTSVDSFGGILFVSFLMCALWTLGIHGNNVVGSVTSPIFLTFLASNIEAVTNGDAPQHIAADGFLLFGMNLGGTGAIIGLAVCMLFAKSKQYKTLGKISFFPSVFGISEPIMFGVPVVLNPILAIPFIGIPLILQGITYFLINFGIIGHVVAAAPWTTPPIIAGFLITGGDWRAALWQGIEVILAIILYYPFFKKVDNQALKNEAAIEKI
ncbi:PTS sugar transporter subunit IIC [Vagococcus elongatus]|uniref:PTS sugar transporter subunit IIC n=1 Tax=Vagococcus elongatus TaxID=180344 RepID=UPI001FE7C647|nr:PTS transporter subunit EIIC [Vagococcus elongatus]